MRIHILSICFVLAFWTTLFSQEQPTWYLGPYGSLLQSIHKTDFLSLPGYPTCCTENRSGMGLGYDIGLLMHIPIQEYGFRLFAGINNPSATIFSDEKIGNQFIRNNLPPFDSITRDITVRHEIDANITAFSLRPMATYSIPFGGDLMAGFGLSYVISHSFSQREKLLSPDNASFANGRGVRNESAGNIPSISMIQSSFIIGYSHNVPISKTSRLIPYIEYHHPLQSLTSYIWNIQKLQLGMALSFGIIPSKETVIHIDTIIQRDTVLRSSPIIAQDSIGLLGRTTAFVKGIEQHGIRIDTMNINESYIHFRKVVSTLNGDIIAMGVDNNGALIPKPIIRIEEWEQVETFPLLPYIYFDESSADLGGTSQHLLLPSETARFHEDSLSSSTLDIYRDLLNIIGKRMKEEDGNLTISGYRNQSIQESSTELSKSRAQSIQSYLTSTWGITPNRMKIQFGGLPLFPTNEDFKEGLEENSRAEIQSNESALLSPLKKRTVIKTMNPPFLTLKPSISNDTPIHSWNITIEDSKEIVHSISGIGNLPDSMFKWKISPNDNMHSEPLIITFSVIDTFGINHKWTTTTSTDRITLKNKQELRINDTLIERFALILFEFNKSTLSPANQQIAKMIRESVKKESLVKIIGHTDLSGSKDYNFALSNARCKEVQRFLGLKDNKIELVPLGGGDPPFENNTPQGRAYSRTVFVEIRTPNNSFDK